MAPPEVWGPPVWNLIHTLSSKIREDAYPILYTHLFNIIVKICKFLPCPECSNDASIFLAKIKSSDIKTKNEFKNIFYLFHNYVNTKKRKKLYNYHDLRVYEFYNLNKTINNFIINYQTKGNMKLLTESFQRIFVIKEFKNFITKYYRAFIPKLNIPSQICKTNCEIINDDNIDIKNDNIDIKNDNIDIKNDVDNLNINENNVSQ